MLNRAPSFAGIAAAAILLLLVYDLSYLYRNGYESTRSRWHDSHHAQAIFAADTLSPSETTVDNAKPSAASTPVAVAVATPALSDASVALVVASLAKEDTTWIPQRLRDWSAHIYVVDDPSAPLTVPINKGKEAMVYLTYIIDNYYKLPDLTIFKHSARFQWHSDDPDYDGLALLQELQLPYARSQGYVNLRCVLQIGCPGEVRPFIDEGSTNPNKATAAVYRKAFKELLPGRDVPETVGVNCCAEFAATREVILAHDITDYERMRNWLINTKFPDHISGTVFEYLWHIVFGKEAVHCQAEGGCYCKLFGRCECEGTGSCDKYWTWPRFQSMPKGWPYLGWDGETRNYTPPVWA